MERGQRNVPTCTQNKDVSKNYTYAYHIFRAWYDCWYTMIMMAKPMKAHTESADPVLNNTDYISKLKN